MSASCMPLLVDVIERELLKGQLQLWPFIHDLLYVHFYAQCSERDTTVDTVSAGMGLARLGLLSAFPHIASLNFAQRLDPTAD